MRVFVLGAGVVGSSLPVGIWRKPVTKSRCSSASRARPPDELCERRSDLGKSRRAVGESRSADEGAEVALQGGCAASLSAACRSAPVELGPALPLRMPAFAHPRKTSSDRAPRRLQPWTFEGAGAETGIEYDHLERGILHFYTNRQIYDRALGSAELMRRYGCDRSARTSEECIAIEPALASVRDRLAGGTYTKEDESGDADPFTVRLAELAAALGVSFRTSTRSSAGTRRRTCHSSTRAGRRAATVFEADVCVVAMGSYSPPPQRPLGLRIPVYPVKGYSATLPIMEPRNAPFVSLTDDEYQI